MLVDCAVASAGRTDQRKVGIDRRVERNRLKWTISAQEIMVGGTFGGISARSMWWTICCAAVGSSILYCARCSDVRLILVLPLPAERDTEAYNTCRQWKTTVADDFDPVRRVGIPATPGRWQTGEPSAWHHFRGSNLICACSSIQASILSCHIRRRSSGRRR